MIDKLNQDISVIQNLKDAGCDTDIINRFFQLQEEEKTKDMLSLLSSHKRILLHKIHENQKKLDCLDYLIFNIRKNKNLKPKRKGE